MNKRLADWAGQEIPRHVLNRMFITVPTTACYWIFKSEGSSPQPHHITWRSIGMYTLMIPTNAHTYLLTPWSRVLLEKPTGFAANQEIPRILWNPKVHYRTHKRPPPVPILSQLHPVPTTQLPAWKIYRYFACIPIQSVFNKVLTLQRVAPWTVTTPNLCQSPSSVTKATLSLITSLETAGPKLNNGVASNG